MSRPHATGRALRDLGEYCLAWSALAVLNILPRGAAFAVARGYTCILDLAVPRLRRTAMRNLAMALPQLDAAEHARISGGVFASIARLLVAFARFPRIRRENMSDWIRCEGVEHVQAALARGKGVLFATAHLGNWELSAFAYALIAAPIHIVVRPLDNPYIDRLVARRRTLSGNRIIDKKEFARPILKALRDNEAVGILMDQNASPDNGVFVDFFGIPACAGAGFAKLAAHSGAAVIPGFALWSDHERRYVLRFYPAIELTGDAATDTARIHRQLESVIRQHPDQWLWIHRRWKTRPAGEPPMYG